MAYPTARRSASGYEFGLEPASAVQNLPTAITQIVPNGNLVPLTATAGAVTLTGVQTILPSSDGHPLTLMNIDGNRAVITLIDDATGGNTKVFLNGPPHLHIFPGQSVRLIYSTLLGGWVIHGAVLKYSDLVHDVTTPPATPNTMDDRFDDSTGMSGSSNGLASKWVWRNQSTSTAVFTKRGVLDMVIPQSNANSWRIIEQAVASGDFSFSVYCGMTGAMADFAGVGLVAIDRTNGDGIYNYLSWRNGPINWSVQTWTSPTVFSSTQAAQVFGGTGAYLRVDRVSTNIITYFSTDRLNWARAAVTADIGSTGIALATYEQSNTGISVGHFRDFRRDA